ncbi:P-loop containing nucleoside triphosphate hydrolase protein [Neofusicoccum parvum]|uniref:P-loop containing nucleoside triphosphate hydrolase protein n=1 Tax=Neofusicoccum parvum TaxID=310453 RepID=A0ACB5S4A2_9PEZI|nr:P-loop containing nucleoside triphosphate hydrolase protein [Neofusicoccum parvum]
MIHYDSPLSDLEAMLLPPVIHGFFMKEKKWIGLLVENVGHIEWNKDAYERLVLPQSTKDLVKALIMVRKSKSGAKLGMSLAGKRDDIIAGKGNGLIMLLHGGPGTGKTLTAGRHTILFQSWQLADEEQKEMPLYSVTCGDVGTKPDVVEQYMNTVLHLGKTWNCVLLLDEADVFLEERTLSDVERNSLVSVFLRVLEYYEGILILTSNRVGTLDEAFKSRIQVALQYPPLNRPSRKQIWRNFFDMLETDDEEINLHELRRRIDELTSHEMNGRQIRNVLTTARQLAMYKQETLGWNHLEQAIKTASAFDTYLRNVQGHTEEQWAADNKLR